MLGLWGYRAAWRLRQQLLHPARASRPLHAHTRAHGPMPREFAAVELHASVGHASAGNVAIVEDGGGGNRTAADAAAAAAAADGVASAASPPIGAANLASSYGHEHDHTHGIAHTHHVAESQARDVDIETVQVEARSALPAEEPDSRARGCHCPCHRNMSSRAKTSLIALVVGILHGIGGPGGVLAVLPTLLMPGLLASCLYLGAFCIFATLTMGAVAGVYGACTYRSKVVSPSLPWILQFVSASTSVFIGLVWLVCSATGTLSEVLEAVGID